MTDAAPDLTSGIEGQNGILVLRGSGITRGWNGIRYKTGISGKNVGAKKLSMNVATVPPGGVAYAHIEPGVPHEVCNVSDTEPVVAVVARSDASEWENIVDYPSGRRP